MPKLRVVSVAFPVYRASRAAAAAAAAGGPIATQAGDGDGDGNGNGNGNANDAEANDDEDEHSTRSKASRSAYLSAFPLALESAGKTGVQARILDLHFGRPSGGGEGEGGEEGAERRGGTRTNFAECILDRRQHFRGCRIEDEDADEGEDEDEEAYACRPEIPHQEGYDSPSERYADVDASANPNADPYEDHVLGNDLDGMEMPVSSFWDVRPSFVWTLVGERAVRLRA